MDYEHDHFQNPANATRRPSKAFYFYVLQHGMGTYSSDEVATLRSNLTIPKKAVARFAEGKWAFRKPDCRQMFSTRNKLFAHLRDQLHFSIPKKAPVELSVRKWACQQPECRMTFPTRKKLFAHLRERLHFSKSIVPTYQITPGTTLVVVKLSRKPHMETRYAFRSFKFPEARIGLSASAEDQWADEGWFGDNFAEAHIAQMQTPIKVQAIAAESHISTLYTVTKIIMPAVRKTEKVMMELVRSYVLSCSECAQKRKVIKSGMRGRGRNRRMHYLVRWKEYGPEFDEWAPVEEIERASDLIEELEARQRDQMNVMIVHREE